MKNKQKKCNHEWELSHIDWQNVNSWTGTGGYGGTSCMVEYAYFFCHKCLKVIKKVVDDK